MAYTGTNLDTSAITGFQLEDSGILIQKAVLGADFLEKIDVRPGYPMSDVRINVLDSTASFSEATCGGATAGTTTFTQLEISNLTYAWAQDFCLEDLRDTWLSTRLDESAFGETLPLQDIIADQLVAETRLGAETKIASALIAIVEAGGVATGGTGQVAFTSTNAYAMITDLIDNLPIAVAARQDLTAFMSYASFRALMQNLVSLNYFHYDPGTTLGTGMGQSVNIPGTNIKAVPVAGWGTDANVLIGPAKHIVATVGLTTDPDSLMGWWSQDQQLFKTLARFTAGVQLIKSSFVTNNV